MPNQPSGKQPKNCYRDKKSPFWMFDFVINGERDCGSTGEATARAAAAFVETRKALMRERQAAGGDLRHGRRRKENISVAAACEVYKEKVSKPTCDPTVSYQLANIVAILCEENEDRLASDVGTADLERYRSRRRQMVSPRKRPVGDSSINREIELARRVWRYAERLGYDIGEQPDWSAVIDKTAEVQRVRELTSDEEARLASALATINPDLWAMAEFAMISGQRKKALVKLLWSSVDLNRKQATILLKGRGLVKKEHTFPLTRRLVEIIQSRPKVGPFVFTYACRRNAPPRNDRPRRVAGERFPFSEQGWTRQWKAALADACIENFRWHDLRHTAATRLLREVNNLKAAQVLLGHTTIDQTARYAHVFTDDLRTMMERAAEQRIGRARATDADNENQAVSA